MVERIADVLAAAAIICALAFGGVAAFERDGILAVAAALCVTVGYGAVRVAEGERKDRKFEVEIGGEASA